MAEIPTKDSVLPSLPWLATVDENFAGVDEESNTPEARRLWNERLEVCHRGNARRLRELYVSHGVYVPLCDYNLPGKLMVFLPYMRSMLQITYPSLT